MLKKYTFHLAEVRCGEEDEMEVEIPEGATEEEIDEILRKELVGWIWNYVDAYWEEARK